MSKRTLVFYSLLILAIFLMSTPVLAQKVRGVTDTEILIGQWGPQTGPAAPWGAVARGTDLLVKIINEEGGIHGRKFKYFLRDDSYQPAKTKAIAKEFVEQIGVFAVVGGVGVATGMTARDYLMENKVPWCGPVTGVYEWISPIQKYLFAIYPLYDDEAFNLTGYLYEKLGFKKIAMFYQNDDYGKQGVMGVERYLLKHKIKLVEKVSAEVTDRDLSTHALKLKNSGADAVIMWTMPTHGALILAETAKIGFKPQWATSNTLSDSALMIQITKGLWAGMINSFWSELPDSSHPLMVKYREWHKKLAPQERWGVFYYGGIIFAEPFFEGVRRAGRNLTPETWISAMETLKNWQGIGPPISYSKPAHPMDRQGGKHVFYGKVKPDGNIQRLTDWIQITK
ncbi:MAG: ABC transporter substrate-binding protein [Deltaproteobacteria bacterium RBG_16_48_10]|nr:MAG: ABC transporter substrate-binding protein [Deltaproteobacteria bacterium RBG_16_48_10]